MLRDAKMRSALTHEELWLRYFGLGGSANREQLLSYLTADGPLGRGEVNAVVQALNEHFLDLGQGMPLAYVEPGSTDPD